MSSFLFQKEVDQSLLKSGLTIPVNMHDKIQEAIGVQLSKGQRANITILLDEKKYDAVLTNVNFSEAYSGRVVFQIRMLREVRFVKNSNRYSHIWILLIPILRRAS